MRKINQAGEDLIKSFEGLKLKPYLCQAGVLTVGWGHTGDDIVKDKTYTKEECQSLFEKDIAKFEKGVEDLVKVDLNDNQFSALVSFAYNVGLGDKGFGGSTLLRRLNLQVPPNIVARSELGKWCHVKGQEKENDGLRNRRNAELVLFVKEIPDELA